MKLELLMTHLILPCLSLGGFTSEGLLKIFLEICLKVKHACIRQLHPVKMYQDIPLHNLTSHCIFKQLTMNQTH